MTIEVTCWPLLVNTVRLTWQHLVLWQNTDKTFSICCHPYQMYFGNTNDNFKVCAVQYIVTAHWFCLCKSWIWEICFIDLFIWSDILTDKRRCHVLPKAEGVDSERPIKLHVCCIKMTLNISSVPTKALFWVTKDVWRFWVWKLSNGTDSAGVSPPLKMELKDKIDPR